MQGTCLKRWGRKSLRLFAGHEEGQAIFFAVGFFLLLAGLLFLVVNTGDQLNTKVSMQNAADAATATGAAWYARGLNIISMCNATEAQVLSFILFLDTLEEAVPPAKAVMDDFMANMGSSAAGHDMPTYGPLSWLTVSEAQGEKDIIDKLYRILQALPLEQYCTYDSGVLWQICYLLDAFAEEIAEITPRMAQEQAMRVAQFNEAEFGFIVPLWPELPIRHGTFEDFNFPMRNAQMPPPLLTDIGGFKRIFYPDWKAGRSGGPRRPPFATGSHFGGGGPFCHFRQPLVDTQPMGLFDLSHLATMFLMVSDSKFRMMFGSTDDRLCVSSIELDYNKALKIHEEEVAARAAGNEPDTTILRTWWEDTRFNSKEEFPNALFYETIDLRDPQNPETVTRSYDRWVPAPNGYTRATTTHEGADPRLSLFYQTSLRKAANYPALGIIAPHPPYHEDGTEWPYTEAEKQPYYHTSMYRFDGVELEKETQLHRKYLPPAGQVPNLEPILLDRSIGDNKVAHKNERFTFMGFAYTSGKVTEWPTRFVNPNPNEKTVCFAQARVFNATTWDLFTQDWRLKLMRVDRWNSVLEEISAGFPPEASVLGDYTNREKFEPVIRMMGSYGEDFVDEVTH